MKSSSSSVPSGGNVGGASKMAMVGIEPKKPSRSWSSTASGVSEAEWYPGQPSGFGRLVGVFCSLNFVPFGMRPSKAEPSSTWCGCMSKDKAPGARAMTLEMRSMTWKVYVTGVSTVSMWPQVPTTLSPSGERMGLRRRW